MFSRSCKFNIFVSLIVLILLLGVSLSSIAAEYTFQIAFEDPLWGEAGIWAMVFASSVKEQTNGEVEIKISASDEWGGGEESYLENIQQSTLPMALVSTSSVAQYADGLASYDTPFLFRDIIQQMNFTFKSLNEHTPLVEKKLKEAGENAKAVFLALTPMGRRDVFANRPINSFDDFKGLKIRTMMSPVQVEAFKALGAVVTPMAYGETYMGLQMKTIDAMENSPSIYMTKKYYEVAPYWIGTRHYAVTMVLAVSQKAWDSLPESYQRIIKDCAVRSANIDGQWAVGNAELNIQGMMKKVTKTMVMVSEEEQLTARAKVLPVLLDKFYKKIGLDVIEELAKEDNLIAKWLENKK